MGPWEQEREEVRNMTMGCSGFKFKKDLKAAVGQSFRGHVVETSMFGDEYREPGTNLVVGPDAYSRRDWFAQVTVDADGIITAVS